MSGPVDALSFKALSEGLTDGTRQGKIKPSESMAGQRRERFQNSPITKQKNDKSLDHDSDF